MKKQTFIAIVFLLLTFCGCSWQGQKAYKNGQTVSEWWSMRFCWVSGGIETYTKTPYYESCAIIKKSQTDPNAIEATGTAAGAVVGGIIKGIK